MGKRKHGMNGTPTYTAWCAMTARCLNPKHKHWKRYGGRGIAICERWRTFINFLADMGERPAGATLDRKDGNGNYEPGNCRWATRREQARNTRRNANYTLNGRTQCLSAWCAELGIGEGTVRTRIKKLGWDPVKALTTSAGSTKQNHWITFNGRTMAMADWAKHLGISLQTLSNRLNTSGWPVERALTEPVRK